MTRVVSCEPAGVAGTGSDTMRDSSSAGLSVGTGSGVTSSAVAGVVADNRIAVDGISTPTAARMPVRQSRVLFSPVRAPRPWVDVDVPVTVDGARERQ